MTKYVWPDQFDVRTDDVFQKTIKPFIEKQLAELKDFDEQREAWTRDNLPADYKFIYRFHEHTFRVAEDMRAAALYMGLPENVAENLYWAMLPHDIGKKALPVDLWDMMEKPSQDIKDERRSHTDLGAEMARNDLPTDHPFVQLMIDIMQNHHEEVGGGGYHGLTGDALSGPVRLACIVESFDGYSIFRPHFGNRDISVPGVLKRMRDEKGADLYDMDLFETFAEMKLANENGGKKRSVK
ncbi:MAG: HD domain-containing protein [Alphaproteobacteria bacterium]|nr:HD domain-containing protein [Alphaproteobacteria bacterium]MBU0859118.1 HD domain-containing protein [Alphaproteobacteria bacterium]